jgi:hypothetical protein
VGHVLSISDYQSSPTNELGFLDCISFVMVVLEPALLDEQANLNSIFTDAMTIIDLLNGMYNSQSAGG